MREAEESKNNFPHVVFLVRPSKGFQERNEEDWEIFGRARQGNHSAQATKPLLSQLESLKSNRKSTKKLKSV